MINQKRWSVLLTSKIGFFFWFLGSFIGFKNDRIFIIISLIAAIWIGLIPKSLTLQIEIFQFIIHLIRRRPVWNSLFAFRTYLSEMALISITKWHKQTDGADKLSTNKAWDIISTTIFLSFISFVITECDFTETK